jgi:hypothetical protein
VLTPDQKQANIPSVSAPPNKIPSKIREGRADLIDQDNLVSTESVGTFRWNDSIKLIDTPPWKKEYE